ncbi:MAG: hypothetical protein ABIA63_05605 [bacterium]
MDNEQDLIQKAKGYIKAHYGEETTHVKVVENNVVEGKGTFIIDCTVIAASEESSWRKTFTFEENRATYMTWKPLSNFPTEENPPHQ